MKMSKMSIVVLVIMLMGLIGCGRDPGYLYSYDDAPDSKQEIQSSAIKTSDGSGCAGNKVDILWVVDNSGSMSSHQNALIRNADIFITDFLQKSKVDWRMGLISSTENQNPYLGFPASAQGPFFDSSTSGALRIFQNAIRRLGTSGSATEKFFAPIMSKIRTFPHFVRKDAFLVLILLTDAAEQSRSISASNFLAFLKSQKGDLCKVRTYTALHPLDMGCRDTDGSRQSYGGSKYEQLNKATKGKVYNLCGADFGKSLANISGQIAKLITADKILLRQRPLVKTIRVLFKGKELPGGPKAEGGTWYYDHTVNAIVFYTLSFAPGDRASVTVEYKTDTGQIISNSK